MNGRVIEKSLRHFLKCNGGYSLAVLISFLITSTISFADVILEMKEKYNQLEIQKEKIYSKLFEVKTEIQKLEDENTKTTHILFTPRLEKNYGRKNIGGYNIKVIENKPVENKPPIKIESLIVPITPNVPIDINFPTSDETLVEEPKIKIVNVGDISFVNIPRDISISLRPISFYPKVDKNKINIATIDKSMLPKLNINSLLANNIKDITVDDNVSINVTEPKISDNLSIPLFDVPEFDLKEPKLILPITFSIKNANLNSRGLEQTDREGIIPENSGRGSIVQNLTSYKSNGNLYVKFTNNDISYGINEFNSMNSDLGQQVMYLNGVLNGKELPNSWNANNIALSIKDYALRSHYLSTLGAASFITDLRNKDTLIEGNYNFKYECSDNNSSRIFTSINPAGLATTGYGGNETTEITKITKFNGELNLTTGLNLKGTLVGFEHQLWDLYNITTNGKIQEHFFKSSSILLNDGIINLGSSTNIGKDTNMIGVAIDVEQSELKKDNVDKKVAHKFINNGEINIYGINSIGVSFEPYTAQEYLKYETYLGKINLKGSNSYGVRMGNIFSDKKYYFDNVIVKGSTPNDKITITDTDSNSENSSKNSTVDDINISNYQSKILVEGTENIGIMIGKSVSSDKDSNPISNFLNINLEVDGDKTIGLLRDKNYSSNNANDMIINDNNFSNINFGKNAKSSVLLRSEMYGITLDKDLNIKLNPEQKNNVILQAVQQTWNKDNDKINSVGSITNKKSINMSANNSIAMMANGNFEKGITKWHNNINPITAKIKNEGDINITGDNNIAMTILDTTSGVNNGNINLTGENNIGVFNEGIFNSEKNSTITVLGNNSIGISNKGTLNLEGVVLNNSAISSATLDGVIGILSENGTTNFIGNNILNSENNGVTGFYSKGVNFLTGSVNINNYKIGFLSDSGILNIDGNITYDGLGFALLSKNDGQIKFSPTSTLTLLGNSYGFTINPNSIGSQSQIDFNNATINVGSSNVTVFNIVAAPNEKFSTQSNGVSNLPGTKDLEKYVGKFKLNSSVQNYKIASIDGGNINFDGSISDNLEFLKKYKFQGNRINITSDTEVQLTNSEANTFFNGEVVGIALNSSPNIIKPRNSEGIRNLTCLNINSNLIVNRLDLSPNAQSTVGAYIDYGTLNLGEKGKIVVEKQKDINDVINIKSIGIYAKDGSKITTAKDSVIDVYGDNGIGIHTISALENKYGFLPLPLSVENSGTINILGDEGIGIYADNLNSTKGNILNSGIITVNNTSETSSIGIYSKNNSIMNTGAINVKSSNGSGKTNVGIYAKDSDVRLGDSTIGLGKNSTGIILKGTSSLGSKDSNLNNQNFTLTFIDLVNNLLEKDLTQINKNGIIFDNNATNNIDFNVDMSKVISGKAIIAKNSNINIAKGKEIKVSAINGKAIKVDNGKAINNGTITIEKENQASNNLSNKINLSPAIGMIASKDLGILDNKGTINILGSNGIGMYVKNEARTNNSISNIGTINLIGKNSIGLLLKGGNYDFNSANNFNFIKNSNSKGIFATKGTKLTFGENFNNKVLDGNTLVAALGKDTLVIDNSNLTLDKDNAVGFFLKNGAQYIKENRDTKLTLKDGAIGIYSGFNSKNIDNINIVLDTDTDNLSSVGVILDEDYENDKKNLSGNIVFNGIQNDIGVVARGVNLDLSKGLTFDYNNGNGTGIFLNNSNILDNSTLNITGVSSINSKNNIGIYVENSNEIKTSLGNLTLNINKDTTIGTYVKSGVLSAEGNINIGNNTDKTVKNSTGIFVDNGNTLDFSGNITLDNTFESSGIVSEGGIINNKGTIVLNDNKHKNIGVVLKSNSRFNGENGTIKISNQGSASNIGIGIYATGNNIDISNIGKFDLAKNNIALYSSGANINTDINMVDLSNLNKNSETLGIMAKSIDNAILTIGGTEDKLMNIKLAKNSVGIIGLDDNVRIKNLNLDMTMGNSQEKNTSYGIIIGGEDQQNNHWYLDNINITSFAGTGIALNSSMVNVDIKNSKFDFASSITDQYKGIAIVGQQWDNINIDSSIFNLNSSYGIYGNSSNIYVNSGTFNLFGESNAIFGDKSGTINIGEDVKVNLAKNSSGNFVYMESGFLTNNADIISNNYLSSFNAIVSDNPTKLTNNGNISLQGDKIFGIAVNRNNEIVNNGNISISGKKIYDPNVGFSFGIYSSGGKITNNGDITLGNSTVGIAYTGKTKYGVTSTGKIRLNGQNNIGVLLTNNDESRSIKNLSISNINSSTKDNIGVYINNYLIENVSLGKINLGSHSSGVYLKDSTISNLNIDSIQVHDNSIALSLLNNKLKNTSVNDMNIRNNSIALYLENSNLDINFNNFDNVLKGKGSVIGVLKSQSNMNLTTTTDKLTLTGNIGFLLEDGSSIRSNTVFKEINVSDGGTGLVVKGKNNNYSSLINENTNIIIGSGSLNDAEKELLSVGAYFKDANDFENVKQLNFVFKEEKDNTTEYAVGGVLKNTYGTLNTSLNLHSGVKNSIGIIATNESQNSNLSDILTIENRDSENLITISGCDNVGLVGENINILTKGDIVIESDEKLASMGVSLTSKDSNNFYEGNGNISLTGTNIGINAVSYDIIQNGNLEIKGSQSIGVSNINKNKIDKDLTLNGNIKIDGLMSTGVFTYNSNLNAYGTDLDIRSLPNYLGNSIGVFSKGNGDLNIGYENVTLNGKNNIAIYKEIKKNDLDKNEEINSQVNVEEGHFNIINRNFGIMTQNQTSALIELNNKASFNLKNKGIGIYTIGKTQLLNDGNMNIGDGSRGIYMTVSNFENIANGVNNGNIIVKGNESVGVHTRGYINFENNGNIIVENNGSGIGLYGTSGSTISNNFNGTISVSGKNSYGMFAKNTANVESSVINYGKIDVFHEGIGMAASGSKTWAINSGTINVFDNGLAMLANGENATALNEGVINLKRNILFPKSLVGMAATNGGVIINSETGNINVEDGTGMYFDSKSKFENKGTITLKNGVGILGEGVTINDGGKIIITNGGAAIKNNISPKNEENFVINTERLFEKEGALMVDTDHNLAIINENFKNIGGVVESDYNLLLKDPTIDITKGSFGIKAPHIEGSIKLDSKFAITGNGIDYKFEKFLPKNTKIDIDASPLYDVDIKGEDVVLSKIPYKDLTLGSQFDSRDDILDNILAEGGEDANKLKEIHSYLIGLSKDNFQSEIDRIASGIGGNVYSNIQDRVGDINRAFKNSFEDMYYSKNLSPQNDKYHIITTTGKRRYKDILSPSYDYNMIGLNYMKEWERIKRKSGYEGGFLVSKFNFKNSSSKEDVYSLNGGTFNYLPMGNFGIFTRLSTGINYHRTQNIVDFGRNSARSHGNYMSYVGSLKNTLDYNFIDKTDYKVTTFIGSELQYTFFDTIKEKGDLALKVKSNDYFSNKVIVGIKGNTFTQLNENWYLKFRGDIKFAHEFENLKLNRASFKNENTQEWALLHSPMSKDTISLKGVIGISKNKTFDVDLSSEIIQDFKKDDKYWNVGLVFTLRFNDHKDLIDTFSSSTYYDFDKDSLNSKEKNKMTDIINYLKNSEDEKVVYISGNTDNKGSEKYNDDLSIRRAKSVKKILTKEVKNSKVKYKIIGNGELKPKFYNTTPKYRAYNRRTDIIIK